MLHEPLHMALSDVNKGLMLLDNMPSSLGVRLLRQPYGVGCLCLLDTCTPLAPRCRAPHANTQEPHGLSPPQDIALQECVAARDTSHLLVSLCATCNASGRVSSCHTPLSSSIMRQAAAHGPPRYLHAWLSYCQATPAAASPAATPPWAAVSCGGLLRAAPSAVWSRLGGLRASRSASASHTRCAISRHTCPRQQVIALVQIGSETQKDVPRLDKLHGSCMHSSMTSCRKSMCTRQLLRARRTAVKRRCAPTGGQRRGPGNAAPDRPAARACPYPVVPDSQAAGHLREGSVGAQAARRQVIQRHGLAPKP